jgi:hypothetical protein
MLKIGSFLFSLLLLVQSGSFIWNSNFLNINHSQKSLNHEIVIEVLESNTQSKIKINRLVSDNLKVFINSYLNNYSKINKSLLVNAYDEITINSTNVKDLNFDQNEINSLSTPAPVHPIIMIFFIIAFIAFAIYTCFILDNEAIREYGCMGNPNM